MRDKIFFKRKLETTNRPNASLEIIKNLFKEKLEE